MLQLSFTHMLSHLQVTLDSNALSTELKVTNTDAKPFSFTTALHTYFRVSIFYIFFLFRDWLSMFHDYFKKVEVPVKIVLGFH